MASNFLNNRLHKQRYSALRLCLKQVTLIIGILALTTGMYLGSVGLILALTNHRYASQGAWADAQITSLSKSDYNERTPKFYAHYTFQTKTGALIANKCLVGRNIWSSLKTGSTIQIQYLPNTPEENRIPEETYDFIPWLPISLGSALMLTGIALLFHGVLKVIGIRKIITHGKKAEAEVISIQETNFAVKGVKQLCLLYRFTDFHGKTWETGTEAISPEEASLWKVGEKGIVRYVDGAPPRCIWIGQDEQRTAGL